MDRLPVSAGGDGFVNCLLFGLCEGLVARLFLQREDPVYLATHLSDRRADRVGDREMLWLDQLRSARQAITQQDAAAANHHDWDRLRACLHSVDRQGNTILHQLERALDQILVEVCDAASVADVGEPCRDRNVSRGQRIASEAEGF